MHVTRLGNYFERAGIGSSMSDALETMHVLREAEPLGGGYWIPTPIRAVDLSRNICLLVAPHPTVELRRHFVGARRAGAGRVADVANVQALPRQSLNAWRGTEGQDARTWAAINVDEVLPQLAPSLMSEGLEVFGTRMGNGRFSEPEWLQPGSAGICEWRGVRLFRTRMGATRYRYFFGKQDRGTTLMEGPAVRDALRLQFGLASLAGRTLVIRVRSVSNTTFVSLPMQAPVTVRRLLRALCDEEPRSAGRIWRCCVPELLPILMKELEELNCETTHYE